MARARRANKSSAEDMDYGAVKTSPLNTGRYSKAQLRAIHTKSGRRRKKKSEV